MSSDLQAVLAIIFSEKYYTSILISAAYISVLALNYRMAVIFKQTFHQDKNKPYFTLLVCIQLFSIGSLLTILVLGALVTILLIFPNVFLTISFVVLALLLYVFITSPSQIALLNFLLCIQRCLLFLGVKSKLASSSCGIAVFLSIVFNFFLGIFALAWDIYGDAEQVPRNALLRMPAAKICFKADIILRISTSLISTVAYASIYLSIRHETSKSNVKRSGDEMIIMQVLPIAVFEMSSSTFQLWLEFDETRSAMYRCMVVVCNIMLTSLVVPLSIGLSTSKNRQMFFAFLKRIPVLSDGQWNDDVVYVEDVETEVTQSGQILIEPITAKESVTLAKMYAESYEVFHHKTSKASKNGKTEEQILLETMQVTLQQRGSTKSTKQIEQKIRDDLKRVKKYEALKRGEHAKPGGGRALKAPRLSQAQQYILDELGRKPRIGGLECGIETAPKEAAKNTEQQAKVDKVTPKSSISARKQRTSSPRLAKSNENLADEREIALEADREANLAALQAYKTMQSFYEMAMGTEKVEAAYYRHKLRSLEMCEMSDERSSSSNSGSRSLMQ